MNIQTIVLLLGSAALTVSATQNPTPNQPATTQDVPKTDVPKTDVVKPQTDQVVPIVQNASQPAGATGGTTQQANVTKPVVEPKKECNLEFYRDSPGRCKELSAHCMSKIASANLPTACLTELPQNTLDNLSTNTAKDLMGISIKNMPNKKEWFVALFKRHQWSKTNEEAFLVSLSQDTDYAKTALDGLASEPEEAARLFNAKTAEHHGPLCARITKEMVPFISTTFFRNMKIACFKAIPEATFEGLDGDRLKPITGELLKSITVKQAEKIPGHAFAEMSVEQARNWGRPFNYPDTEDKEAKQKYLESHPCTHFKKMSPFMQAPARSALEGHCKIKGNSAARDIKVSTSAVALSSLVAAFLMLL